MSRAARITVGSVVAGVLALVALVSGVMAAAGFAGRVDPFAFLDPGVDTPATAEVLDVDENDGWATVDVRWTTPDGEVVVTYVDWEWGELPEVGDEVEVLYDAADPEFAFAADDPYVSDGGAGAGSSTDPGSAAGSGAALDESENEAELGTGDDLSRTAGWVSSAALLGLVVTAVVTIVVALRAPGAPTPAQVPSGFDVLPPLASPTYAPDPADPYQRPYQAQPQGYRHQPGPPQPYPQPDPSRPRPPQQGSWPHPG